MRLSFKKQPKETGLAAVGNYNPFVDIKGDGKKVGWIQPANWHTKYFGVWFHVESPDGWYNMKLGFDGETEKEARQFIKDNWEAIQAKWPLHCLEE